MNNVIAEIIDDESNENIIVYENSHYFSDTFSERGLNVYRSELNNSLSQGDKEIDSAFININISLFENSDPVLKISEVLTNVVNLKKVYILISSNSQNKKILLNLRTTIKIKFLEKKIKFFFSNQPHLYKYETQHILKNNNKVQQILPRYLIKSFYRRSWKLKSRSYILSFFKWIKFILIKFSLVPSSNNILIVFENEK